MFTFSLRLAALMLVACALPCIAKAAEPFLKPNDVIALVGGEDMVAASEYGYLELLLTRALPEHKLKFRCLAWEGDTVFEQRRDLNYPTLEQQLDQIGATVVIAQFGQMESLAGKEKLPEFVAAYEKLIGRLSSGEKRRIALLAPSMFALSETLFAENAERAREESHLLSAHNATLLLFAAAIRTLISAPDSPPLDTPKRVSAARLPWLLSAPNNGGRDARVQREGVHLNAKGHSLLAIYVARMGLNLPVQFQIESPDLESLGQLINAKNRLWFNYYRPQNWAFLAGDRTNQPSSRDHLDPKKRWFPEELEQFLPLIEKKEAEIWRMTAELAKEK